jgi:ribosome maturation factor RimP
MSFHPFGADNEKWLPQLRALAEPLVRDSFLELFDLSVRRQGGRYAISVVLDKADGQVALADCETVSRDLEKKLDELDLIPAAYVLEVSSPGLDRPLRTLEDCRRFLGRKAHLVTHVPIGGQTSFEGRLEAVEAGEVLVAVGGDRRVSIPFAAVKRAELVVEF